MAQYKVPQDVEADDKLIGPFSFRQFVYLMITAGLGGLAFLLFRIFPLLVIIPIPFMIFFLILASPFKKDQPMETYLSAIVSFYLKPRTRIWEPGQGETTIIITAPKRADEVRTKGLSEEEASHRLSFLADIVDTEGYSIKGDSIKSMRSDFYQEASKTQDIFEVAQQNSNYQDLNQSAQARHDQLVNQMRSAIDQNNNLTAASTTISHIDGGRINASVPSSPNIAPATPPTPPALPNFETPAQTQPIAPPTPVIPANPLDAKQGVDSSVIIQPDDTIFDSSPKTASAPAAPAQQPAPSQPTPPPQPSQQIIDLANNKELSIETIAQQAKRIEEKQNNGEVYISLH